MNSVIVSQMDSAREARLVRVATSTPIQQPMRQDPAVAGTNSPSAAATQPAEVQATELKKAVSNINSYVQKLSRDLLFSVDEGTGRTVIKVVDGSTDKLIRQIPSEDVLALARHLQDSEGAAVEGMILNTHI